MGLKHIGNATILGNFSKITKERPKNWFDKDYKIMIPYPFKWREKIGKVECDCTEVMESHMPYYGFNYSHSDECALMKLLKAKPQLRNLWCYGHLPSFLLEE